MAGPLNLLLPVLHVLDRIALRALRVQTLLKWRTSISPRIPAAAEKQCWRKRRERKWAATPDVIWCQQAVDMAYWIGVGCGCGVVVQLEDDSVLRKPSQFSVLYALHLRAKHDFYISACRWTQTSTGVTMVQMWMIWRRCPSSTTRLVLLFLLSLLFSLSFILLLLYRRNFTRVFGDATTLCYDATFGSSKRIRRPTRFRAEVASHVCCHLPFQTDG